MNYQEMDLKELQKLLDVKRLGINVSEDYYKLCKNFTNKRVTFKTLEQLNELFEKFLGFCSEEKELRFDITPYGRGGSQRTKKELQGKYMHAMRSRTLEQMDVLRNSFNSATLKFDTELLKWKLQLNVNFSEIREGKENKTFYTNYFHLGFRMLLTEEEVDADVFLSSLSNSLEKASLEFSKKDIGILQTEIATRTSYSFDNIVSDNAEHILKIEEIIDNEVMLEEKETQLENQKETEEIILKEELEEQNIIEEKKEGLSDSDLSVLYYIYGLNFDEYNETEKKQMKYSEFTAKFITKESTNDSVKESIANYFEIELYDLVEKK